MKKSPFSAKKRFGQPFIIWFSEEVLHKKYASLTYRFRWQCNWFASKKSKDESEEVKSGRSNLYDPRSGNGQSFFLKMQKKTQGWAAAQSLRRWHPQLYDRNFCGLQGLSEENSINVKNWRVPPVRTLAVGGSVAGGIRRYCLRVVPDRRFRGAQPYCAMGNGVFTFSRCLHFKNVEAPRLTIQAGAKKTFIWC
ncbi:MAG: hypothetical protein ACLTMG_03545 [Oscillospiraceae bacterium]